MPNTINTSETSSRRRTERRGWITAIVFGFIVFFLWETFVVRDLHLPEESDLETGLFYVGLAISIASGALAKYLFGKGSRSKTKKGYRDLILLVGYLVLLGGIYVYKGAVSPLLGSWGWLVGIILFAPLGLFLMMMSSGPPDR